MRTHNFLQGQDHLVFQIKFYELTCDDKLLLVDTAGTTVRA